MAAFSSAGVLASASYMREVAPTIDAVRGLFIASAFFLVSILGAVVYVLGHDLRMSEVLARSREAAQDTTYRRIRIRRQAEELARLRSGGDRARRLALASELIGLVKANQSAREAAIEQLNVGALKWEGLPSACCVGGFFAGLVVFLGDAVVRLL